MAPRRPEAKEEGTAAQTGASEAPVAKRRGRPPKNGVAAVPKAPTGRPRGRPKGSGGVAKKKKTETPAAAAAVPTRSSRRGRPPKSAEDAASTPKKADTQSKTSGFTRGRKARKSEAGDESEAAAEEGKDEDEDAEAEGSASRDDVAMEDAAGGDSSVDEEQSADPEVATPLDPAPETKSSGYKQRRLQNKKGTFLLTDAFSAG
ncbi:hypothetical protein F5Y17DRAFT_411625 [Xylariaceae sp. FL0594]|nr:hypothetical protein F5Y17DRAFT_411625 [Xylariaceae sp. FL0594]